MESHLDAIAFDRVLAGEASAVVEAHVDRCDPCRRRLAELARRELVLRRLLFRVTCPASSEELVRWHLGWVSAEEADRIASHVAACAFCREELRLLTADLDSPL